MNRLNIIQQCIDRKGAHNYVEIGVSTGWLLFKVKAPHKIGIDPHFAFPWFNQLRRYLHLQPARFYEETSDVFFEKHADILEKTGGIDVAFVDGLHTYEQAYRDVVHCLKYLNPGGIILMHDCNPPNEACGWPAKDIVEYRKLAATGQIPGYLNSWNGDVWKAVVRLRAQHPELTVGTLDLDWGIGFVYRHPSEAPLPYSVAAIEAMTYADLERERSKLLGLRPPLYLSELINLTEADKKITP